jgi:hypothetical protein
MFQTSDLRAASTLTGPAEPVANRTASPLRWLCLADAGDFGRLLGRKTLRCRRDGQELSALTLQLLCSSADPSPALLDACARRLCGRVRASDVVTSWQASHFGILLLGCRAGHAAAVLSRLLQASEGTYSLDGQLYHLRVQGMVVATPSG